MFEALVSIISPAAVCQPDGLRRLWRHRVIIVEKKLVMMTVA
jgi:hypothetical protein